MNYIGKKCRIIGNEKALKYNSFSDSLKLNGSMLSTLDGSYQGKEGVVVGYNQGHDFGDGTFEVAYLIVRLMLDNEEMKTIRIDSDLVEII